MNAPYHAAPACPSEHADPVVNPSGGDLGWVVADSEDVAVPSFGDGYMCEHVARGRARTLNAGRPGTDYANDCMTCGDE